MNMNKERKKIMIEALHGIGDVVCTIPMIRNVREAYPEAWIVVVVNSQAPKDVLEHSRITIDEIIICNMHSGLKRNSVNIRKLRKYKFDIGIAIADTTITRAYCFFSIIGVKEKIGLQFSKKLDSRKLGDKYHFVEAQLLAIEGFVPSIKQYHPRLFATNRERREMRNMIKLQSENPVVGICVGRGDITYKNHITRRNPVYTRGWGEYDQHVKNMTELVNKCVKQGYSVILLGGKAEENIAQRMIENLSFNVVDMVGKSSMKESIAIASLCNVVVGVDTGMQHVSDALGIPTISLFGPTNSKTHGAYSDKARFVEVEEPCRFCFGTKKYVDCIDRRCMKRITVNEVLSAIRKSILRDL